MFTKKPSKSELYQDYIEALERFEVVASYGYSSGVERVQSFQDMGDLYIELYARDDEAFIFTHQMNCTRLLACEYGQMISAEAMASRQEVSFKYAQEHIAQAHSHFAQACKEGPAVMKHPYVLEAVADLEISLAGHRLRPEALMSNILQRSAPKP